MATLRTNLQSGLYQEIRENYDYDGAGRIATIRETSGSTTSNPNSVPAASASGGITNSTLGYDLTGRARVIVDEATGQRIITVINPKNK